MTDIDIDPFGDHESRPEESMGENISLTPAGGSTWEPECEQETSFGGESQRTRLRKDYVEGLYQKLSESMESTSEAFHFHYFDLRDGELYYYRGKREPLMYRGGKLKMVKQIVKILGKNRLRNLGFDITTGKVTAQEAVMLNRMEELLSESDITKQLTKADDTEPQEIMGKNSEKHRGFNFSDVTDR